MATCTQAEDYVAGKLSAGDARAFEAHAATCEGCGKALIRRKAVERAASVLKRNQVARDSRIDMVAPGAAVPPSKAITVEAPVLAPQTAPRLREPDPAQGSPRGKRMAFGIAGALTVGVAVWIWATSSTSQPQPDTPAPVALAPAPEPQPAAEPAPPQPEVAQPPGVTLEPTREPQRPIAEAVVTVPPPAQAADEVTSPKPADAPTKTPTATNKDAKQQDWLPIGTDIEELAATVAGKKCGAAVTALRDRVVKHKEEARSWALLATCYAKRKRWQHTLDAYDMVVQYGDKALVASIQGYADSAKAGLKADAEAAAAAGAAPAPDSQQ